ncbi:type II 3-dehydroquinate dehydratase [Streptosporangium sp. 'caverna']|uniref:type II 3-dehydroquinate dehydratase n=1 Tax=Streptosporangium sp. 'caverna' TaxID=2202249 RepID=UPI000D7E4E2F|nr:type II 3-dehydroquinate dehydratase [Streptosporangium sp. 'caverna']AWS44753.1 type II 3-dehydroquinate dehydratase [Streptosporangium sp. 'caverna']
MSRAPGARVLVLNGPNLNLLGRREPELYGIVTLDEIESLCQAFGEKNDLLIDFRQSNHEGVLIDAVQEAGQHAAGIVINAAGYTHTSVALRDALASVGIPIVEVHLTNIHRREAYRRTSFVSEVADALICGAGAHGYVLALTHLSHLLENLEKGDR